MPEGNVAGGEEQGAAGEVQQQLADANAKLAAAEGELKISKDAKVDLEQRLDEADKELLSDSYLNHKERVAKEAAGGGGAGGGLELDLDRASNRELAEFVEKKYRGDLDAAMKDIKGQLDLNKQQLGIMAAQFGVALATLKHDGRDGKPSFGENEKEIFVIAKANPRWSAEECYTQFVLQADAKSKSDADAAKKKADDDDKALTEKVGVPGSAVQEKELSPEEAASAGYRKAFGTEK